MNGIAGGGSFVTLPALVAAGMSSLTANATSTVALVPSALVTAFAYRREFRPFEAVSLPLMAGISVVGGAVGATLLLVTSQRIFEDIFPFLLLFGVTVFALGRPLGVALRRRITVHPRALPLVQAVLGVYGGYFGGAVGVLMLAAWRVLTTASLKSQQASRHLLNAAMNATASAIFIAGGLVSWPQMAVLLVTSSLGGYVAGHYGSRLDPAWARAAIIALTTVIVALVFWRRFG